MGFPNAIDVALEEDGTAQGNVVEADEHDKAGCASSILSRKAFGAQKLWSGRLSHSSTRGAAFLVWAAIFFWTMGMLVSWHTVVTASAIAAYGSQVEGPYRWPPLGGWPTQTTPCAIGSSCVLTLPINARMQPPILLSYVLAPCFQNY